MPVTSQPCRARYSDECQLECPVDAIIPCDAQRVATALSQNSSVQREIWLFASEMCRKRHKLTTCTYQADHVVAMVALILPLVTPSAGWGFCATHILDFSFNNWYNLRVNRTLVASCSETSPPFTQKGLLCRDPLRFMLRRS